MANVVQTEAEVFWIEHLGAQEVRSPVRFSRSVKYTNVRAKLPSRVYLLGRSRCSEEPALRCGVAMACEHWCSDGLRALQPARQPCYAAQQSDGRDELVQVSMEWSFTRPSHQIAPDRQLRRAFGQPLHTLWTECFGA
jgi:hypothetical protein